MIETKEISPEQHYRYNHNLPSAEELMKEHENGSSWKEIASKYNVPENTIWSRIKNYKDTLAGKRKPLKILSGEDNGKFRADLDVQKMIEDYQSGMGTPEIAKKYNCGKTTVKRKLKAAGITLRGNSEAHLVDAGGLIREPKRTSVYPEDVLIDNKYLKAYYRIIEKARIQNIDPKAYYEKHHIKPKALRGSNEKTNLVNLTPREHYICHRLLTKCTTGDGKRYMVNAWSRMSRSPKTSEFITSTQYSELRKQLKEVGMSEEHRRKIGDASRGRKYAPRSEEQKARMSEARKLDWAEGKYQSQIAAAKRPKSEETKMKMAEARRKYWEQKKKEKTEDS